MRAVLTIAAALLAPTCAWGETGPYANSWAASEPSTFTHVLEAAPGRRAVTLTARTDSPGGETVAVYPQTPSGERGKVRLMFVIATRQGNSVTRDVTFPAPPRGEAVAKLPVVVVVENASGRRYAGEYTLTVSP